MKQNLEEKKKIDWDERDNPLMTVKTIKYYCSKDSLYDTPELNQKLYLHFKGFRKIESLQAYPNLATIWLNNNCISKIQGLSSLKNLVCLYLNNNVIAQIENLDGLDNLQVLNLAHNKLERISGLSVVKNLTTLNVSQNFLTDQYSLKGLKECLTLTNINLSKNQIQNSQDMFKFLTSLSQLACLYLKATPMSRGFKNYRKRLIAGLPKLKFLDDRPIQQIDHRLAEAWVKGGPQLQKEQRNKIAQEKDEKNKKQTKQFTQKVDRDKQRIDRIEQLTCEKRQLQKLQQTEQNGQKISELQRQIQILKDGPKGYQAQISDTSLKVLCVADEQQPKIIEKYFFNEKKKVQQNIRKLKEQQYIQEDDEKKIEEKVKRILQLKQNDPQGEQSYLKNWNPSYEKLLEALLQKHKFDFWEVQPQFNMILAEINKKMVRPHKRFEVKHLQNIWTNIEKRRRNE